MAYPNALHYPSQDPSFTNNSAHYTVNEGTPEYGYRDWDVISHLEEAPFSQSKAGKKLFKPSIFQRFIRAILGLNLLFGTHFDSLDETLKKRKSNRGKSNLPWKGFFDSQESIIDSKPVANKTSVEVFWPPNSPTLRRAPGSYTPMPPIEEILSITRQPSPVLSNSMGYGISVRTPYFHFPEPVATTTLPEFTAPSSPIPYEYSRISTPMTESQENNHTRIDTFTPEPEENNTGASTPAENPKPMIFTSRIRFPRKLGVSHVTYKLREKPQARTRLRRPSWATLSSHRSNTGSNNVSRSASPNLSYTSRHTSSMSGPTLQFPTLSFRSRLNEEEPEVEEKKEERPIYDITFFDRPGGRALATSDFEVPEGYDEVYASVQVDYGDGEERLEMEEYSGNPDEAEKMKDSGVVVFMFLPED